MKSICHLAAVGAAVLSIALAALPSAAQVIVFDPNNYAQNVLTAARELQQINNQITSLQNQAQSLFNQARNLASLPYSSLQQIQQSIQRTQQLLNQAQRIAYDVQQIDHAFSTTYAPATSSQSSQALIANAQTRWQTSVASLQDALRVQAGVERPHWSPRASQRVGRFRRRKQVISFFHSRRSNWPILPQSSLRKVAHRAWKQLSASLPRTRAGNSSGDF